MSARASHVNTIASLTSHNGLMLKTECSEVLGCIAKKNKLATRININMMQTFDIHIKIATYGVVFINKINCGECEVSKI